MRILGKEPVVSTGRVQRLEDKVFQGLELLSTLDDPDLVTIWIPSLTVVPCFIGPAVRTHLAAQRARPRRWSGATGHRTLVVTVTLDSERENPVTPV